ncbi:MAG: GDP-mannose 4,6-dehydratase [Thermomicrobiales bacterium]
MTRALITGISGQDGYYLATALHERGIEVWGMTRTGELPADLPFALPALPADLSHGPAVTAAVAGCQPDLVFHLAAQTSVSESWRDPARTADLTGMGTARVLESVREHVPAARVFVASSSEVFGVPHELPTDEHAPIQPISPYGAAKAWGLHLGQAYRSGAGMFVCTGILFNHESPRRGPRFVSGKIISGAVSIARGEQRQLVLGNVEARRDWAFAGDVARAMIAMLEHGSPDDYVIATGESHSISDWCERAFRSVGLDWRDHVQSDPALLRPGEAMEQRGNPARANERLGWQPETSFEGLVDMMIAAELTRREQRP